jgi:heme/copper-type cytochrome/quinol oxidase subunit 2
MNGASHGSFDSYMIKEEQLGYGGFRLLETDFRLVLPTQTNIRAIISSTDVLHSWTIPAFGAKLDACPGRLNQVGLFIKREGLFFGQCSEICGINHGYMPITVNAVSLKSFEIWLQGLIYATILQEE